VSESALWSQRVGEEAREVGGLVCVSGRVIRDANSTMLILLLPKPCLPLLETTPQPF
jgi:hypothetical protein